MEKVSYSYARQHLNEILNKVLDDSEPYCIQRKDGKQIVMINKDEYDSLMETVYVLQSPENAKEFLQALEEVKKGVGVKIEL